MTEESIFVAALEKKSPAERQAFLDQACAGNAVLRAAVEELLQADSNAGSFLEHAPLGVDATVASDPNNRDTVDDGGWIRALAFLEPCDKPERIGRLDKYEIIEVVGHGGMGAVLRAFDTKLSRVVAVKVMSPTLAANATAVKRFLREATTAAQVHHDHVVTIHEVDDAHRPPYLVMEFVEGQTLQQKIDREGALNVTTILRIGSQAAAGLAASHKLGVIHRDVKPANILLENGVERVKITDFGLARAADDMQMTQTGIIAGTPQYMSPEQAKGEPIDARSDLFSLGSVLYTMCTGRPAFRADNPVAVLRRVCDDTPRPIREVNPEIPDWLEAIVNKLLAKEAGDRFQSAAEVADLLSQHLAHVQNPAMMPQPARVLVGPHAMPITGLWRDGNLLVMHKHASLPDVCLKSNTKAAHRLKRRLAWHHPALYLILLINPLIYFILALVIQKSATIDMPLSHEWFLRRRQRMAFAWGSVVAGLALIVAILVGNRIQDALLVALLALATFLLLGGITFGLLGCRLVSARRMTDHHIWLRGVHPKFLERLDVWGRAPGSTSELSPKPGTPRTTPVGQGPFPPPPLWLWGTGLVFAVLALLIAFLKINFGFDTRVIAPTFVGLFFIWMAATAYWVIVTAVKRTVRRGHAAHGRLDKLTPRGVFIEHPVLGLVAIAMLLVSVSAATYMLTAAWHRAAGSLPRLESGVPTAVTLILGLVLLAVAVCAQVLTSQRQLPAAMARQRGAWWQWAILAAGLALIVWWYGPFLVTTARNQAAISFDSNDPGAKLILAGPAGTITIHSGGGAHWVLAGTYQAHVEPPVNRAVQRLDYFRRAQLTGRYSSHASPEPHELHLGRGDRVVFTAVLQDSAASAVTNRSLPPSGDWVQLFNGHDLNGWQTHPSQAGFWKVEDGQLVGFGAISHLFSDRSDYQDFHLRVEAQVNDGGSSGVYFRVPEFAVSRYGQFPDGYEANINSTCESDTDRTGSLTGSLRGVASYKETLHRPDEWFMLEVIARGPHIVIQVNGQTTVDFTDANNSFRRGHLALQVWPAQTVARFRKIEIRELLRAGEESSAGSAPPDRPNSEVVQALRELVAAKERSLKTAQARFNSSVTTRTEVLAAEIEHVEARIRLSEVQRQPETKVALLRELVAFREEERRLIEALVTRKVVAQDELNQADARLAEAKARLAEASP